MEQPNIIGETNISGLYAISDLLQFKELFKDMPEDILNYNVKNNIIMMQPTNEVVTNRQKHPVLKKINNVSEISSKIISSLNKISEENISSIVDDIIKIENISTIDGINELVNIIIKKVGSEKQYLQLYASMCTKLSPIRTEIDVKQNQLSVISVVSGRSKEIFDKYITLRELPKDSDKETTENFISVNSLLLDNENKISKDKILNYVKFIGCIYNCGILKQSAIDYCLERLLMSIPEILFGVEIVITLMKIVMPVYTKTNPSGMKKYFERLESFKEKCDKFRDKFMIQDLIDKNKL